MIESRDDPWKSEPEEDVDGVWAGDVADGVVGILFIGGRRLAGEGVGQGSSESNERDGWIKSFCKDVILGNGYSKDVQNNTY